MLEVKIFDTLRQINRDSWNLCFTNEVENYDYLLATEEAGIKGFKWRYVTIWRDDMLIAAMPAFLSDYDLDTTLQGVGKKITNTIRSAFPKLLTLKLACLGSPCTEAGVIGFNANISENEKPELIKAILLEFEKYAAQQKCKLIGIKDIPKPSLPIWKPGFEAYKYADLPSLPTAHLDINFANTEEYIVRLSYKMRKNMRQKLKSLEAVRVVNTNNIDALLPEIMALYNDTRGRSEWQFEELTKEYFTNVLANMHSNAFCTLYYVEDKLLAANLLIRNEEVLVDKFFCMNSEIGRDYNLYFLSWFNNINYCLQHGIKRYQSGQAYYENKVRLGSQLTPNFMYFKHRNILAQGVLKLVAPLLAADETIKEAA